VDPVTIDAVTRRSWLFLLVATIGAWSIVEGARTLVRVSDAVVPGVFYSLRARVDRPLPERAAAAGIAIGDRIASVDGAAIGSAQDIADHTPAIGMKVELRVERDGGEHSIVLEALAPSLAIAALRYASGVVFVLIGVLAFWLHPGRRASWPFLLGCVAYGVTVLSLFGNPRATQSLLQARVGLLAYPTIGPLFVHLFAVFPRPLRAIVRRPWLPIALDGIALALGATLALLLTYDAPTDALLRVVAVLNASCAVAAIAILVWRLRRPAPQEDTSRLRALVLATALAFPVPAGYTLAAAFGWWNASDELPLAVIGAVVLCFPMIVGYAMIRRDLFELDRAVARTAAASAAVGLVAVGFAAIAVAVPGLVAPAGSPTATAIVALTALAALWPLQRRVQRRLVAAFGDVGEDRFADLRDSIPPLADRSEAAPFGRFERKLEEALDVADAALLVRDGTVWRRPSTGEHVTPRTWPQVIELVQNDTTVGAFALGRPGSQLDLGRRVASALEGLAIEVAGALRGTPQGEHVGEYKIERFLAAGGMGNVYLATKVGAAGFAKPVAIKQLLPEIAAEPEAIERFLDEARLVAKLTHPGIVQTLELGQTERGYFIVMEYVAGVDASTLVRRLKRQRRALPVPLACHIVTSACLALEHAHRANLVHHDVSPQNLLIDREGNVKLADFGVAHVRNRPAQRDRLVGKIGYIAPEQLRGDPTDHRVDVFGAGVVLYELVTGQHPFAAGSDYLTLRAIEHGRYLPAEMLREDCPPALAATIDRALSQDLERRFATAAALAEAIQTVYPLDSRRAAELGRLVEAGDAKPSSSLVPANPTLPTARG
jgi:hypothetical protein